MTLSILRFLSPRFYPYLRSREKNSGLNNSSLNGTSTRALTFAMQCSTSSIMMFIYLSYDVNTWIHVFDLRIDPPTYLRT